MLVMPSREGYSVTWEIGETFMRDGIEKHHHGNFLTTSKEEAEKKAEGMKQAGYSNVKIYECIF